MNLFHTPLITVMAIYHLSGKVFSRSKGHSAVGKAAYRSGEDLYDITIDKTFHYAHRQEDVAYSEIITPAKDNLPDWVHDRQELWTKVEQHEKRKDAQLAREFNVALPVELSLDTNINMVKEFVNDNFVSRGMIADIAIHDASSHNPHAHIMLTMREIKSDGFVQKNRDWNKKETLTLWRESWGEIVNDYLEENGTNERVDHRSYEDQGIDKEATIHLGVASHQMEKKGIKTRLGDYNRSVNLRNRARELLKAGIGKIAKTPKEIWNLVKHSPHLKALYPHLKPQKIEPPKPPTTPAPPTHPPDTKVTDMEKYAQWMPPPATDIDNDIER